MKTRFHTIALVAILNSATAVLSGGPSSSSSSDLKSNYKSALGTCIQKTCQNLPKSSDTGPAVNCISSCNNTILSSSKGLCGTNNDCLQVYRSVHGAFVKSLEEYRLAFADEEPSGYVLIVNCLFNELKL